MDAVHSVRPLRSELNPTAVIMKSLFEASKALGRRSLCLTSDVRAKSYIRQSAWCLEKKILNLLDTVHSLRPLKSELNLTYGIVVIMSGFEDSI